jgi:hypothetical protein
MAKASEAGNNGYRRGEWRSMAQWRKAEMK